MFGRKKKKLQQQIDQLKKQLQEQEESQQTKLSPELMKKIKQVHIVMWITFPILILVNCGLYWIIVFTGLGLHKEENHRVYLSIDATLLGLMLAITALIVQLRGRKEHAKLVNSVLWATIEKSLYLGNICLLVTIFFSYMAIKSKYPTRDFHASLEAGFMYSAYVYVSYIVIQIRHAFKHI
jgi:hypothetical protein